MEDVYYVILAKLSLKELVDAQFISKTFQNLVNEILILKIKMKGFINHLKNNTIFPKIVKLKKINVFTKKYRNRENEPILRYN